MEFIMRCYPVREVMLWQWVGNPDCLVSHRVVSCSAATRHQEEKAQPGCDWMSVRQRRGSVSTPVTNYIAHLSFQEHTSSLLVTLLHLFTLHFYPNTKSCLFLYEHHFNILIWYTALVQWGDTEVVSSLHIQQSETCTWWMLHPPQQLMSVLCGDMTLRPSS